MRLAGIGLEGPQQTPIEGIEPHPGIVGEIRHGSPALRRSTPSRPGYSRSMRFAAALIAASATVVPSLLWAQAESGQPLAKWHAASGLPGLCVATADRGGRRFSTGAGWADLDARRPYTSATVQPVGSISKTVVGLAMAMTAVEGRLDLDAEVPGPSGRPLRNPHHPGLPITWRHLATHTSALKDEERAYRRAYEPGPRATTALRTFVDDYLDAAPAVLRQRFTTAKPGEAYEYANLGAAAAAAALEPVTGQDFAAYTAARVFTPLGMTSTSWARASDRAEATLYDARNQPVPLYSLATYPEGGLRTTCDDLAAYAAAVLAAHAGTGTALPGEAVRQMLSPQFTSDTRPRGLPATEPNQGLFWQFRRSGDVGHSGGDPGLSAFLALDLTRGHARVFITNGDLEERPAARDAFTAIWAWLATR